MDLVLRNRFFVEEAQKLGATLMVIVLLSLFVIPASAQGSSKELINVIVNGETFGEIGGEETIQGRVSAHLTLNEQSLKQGIVEVKGFNVVSFGVDQRTLTGIEPKGKATSAVGFRIDALKPQFLQYEAAEGVLVGELQGQLSMDQLFELTSSQDRGKSHDLDMRTIPATISVTLNIGKELQPPKVGDKQAVETRNVQAEIKLNADAFEPLGISKAIRLDYRANLNLVIDWFIILETARQLCIQPVRIGSLSIIWQGFIPLVSIQMSGDGLAFGTPGVLAEWNKADIVFNTRDWITIFNSNYSSLTSGEMSSLRAEVSEDDCIEVFFVDRFDPQTMDGGGNTVSGGTESAKVISSDENADFGVDFTHLAHEYGHVLTLKHPGSGFPTAALPHRVDASTGTLMCGSGFNNDNPTINSEWNEDNIANPLLTFTFKLATVGPDCTNDVDCGACP